MASSSGISARFQIASDQSLLVYFDPIVKQARAPKPAGISSAKPFQSKSTFEGHQQVRRLLRLIEFEPIAGVRNVQPAYSSALIRFDALKLRHEELQELLHDYIARMEKVALPESRLVEIPVCYGAEFGPDLQDVAELRGLAPERVIELHSTATYVVFFLGFVPGFAYLGDLPGELATPRLPTPRKSVPPGSVGIAATQTGVYPMATPGGWRLLGRTPLAMFRAERSDMSLLSIGDRVRFAPISREQFARLVNA